MEAIVIELTYFVVCFIFLILAVLCVIFTLFMNSSWIDKLALPIFMFGRVLIIILSVILVLICILMLIDSYGYLIKTLP